MASLGTLTARFAGSPCAVAALLGAASALGFEPLSLWPLALVAFAGLIEIVSRATTLRGAFLAGWIFGLTHFTVSNAWIATAFTYQSDMPQWLGWIAVVLLATYLALFPALAAIMAWSLVRFVRGRVPAEGEALPFIGLAFVPAWIVSEWLRGWFLTGFAWNPAGLVLLGPYETQGLALTAKWIGTYGLSGLAIGLATFLRRIAWLLVGVSGRRRIALLASAIPVLAVITALMVAPARYLDRPEGARPFTLVQPDLRQEVLDDPSKYEDNFLALARLTVPGDPLKERLVFWPESGLADYLREGYPNYLYRRTTYAADPVLARERIGRVIGPESLLLTGAVDIVVEDGDDVAARNSVTAIDGRGRILAAYAKAHLVPFGEYLPLRSVLEPLGLSRLVAGSLDFWPGPGPRTLDFGPRGRAGILICYEIVFSGQVVDPASRPEFIFNPSNDGWFGPWGPPQHLDQARLRAIEEGLPVLRSTTTGISAVIDADGIVRSHLPRHTAGRIDGLVPPPHEPTLFARFGNSIPLGLAVLLFVVSAVALRRTTR